MRSGIFLATIAAVSCVVGVADAATFHYRLTYDQTHYINVDYIGASAQDDVHYDSLSSRDDPWGLPLLFDGLNPGQSYDFKATIQDDVVTSCSIGTFDCNTGFDPYWSYASESPLSFGSEYLHVSVGGFKSAATWMQVSDVENGGYYGFYVPRGEDGILIGTRTTYFTVAEAEPAPVPLPAGIALLPVGIGALALMRRRKRVI